MREIIIKYRKGKVVEPEDREILDSLNRAALIDYSVRDGELYARSSDLTHSPQALVRFKGNMNGPQMGMEGLTGRFARFHSIGSLAVALAAVSISTSGVLWT